MEQLPPTLCATFTSLKACLTTAREVPSDAALRIWEHKPKRLVLICEHSTKSKSGRHVMRAPDDAHWCPFLLKAELTVLGELGNQSFRVTSFTPHQHQHQPASRQHSSTQPTTPKLSASQNQTGLPPAFPIRPVLPTSLQPDLHQPQICAAIEETLQSLGISTHSLRKRRQRPLLCDNLLGEKDEYEAWAKKLGVETPLKSWTRPPTVGFFPWLRDLEGLDDEVENDQGRPNGTQGSKADEEESVKLVKQRRKVKGRRPPEPTRFSTRSCTKPITATSSSITMAFATTEKNQSGTAVVGSRGSATGGRKRTLSETFSSTVVVASSCGSRARERTASPATSRRLRSWRNEPAVGDQARLEEAQVAVKAILVEQPPARLPENQDRPPPPTVRVDLPGGDKDDAKMLLELAALDSSGRDAALCNSPACSVVNGGKLSEAMGVGDPKPSAAPFDSTSRPHNTIDTVGMVWVDNVTPKWSKASDGEDPMLAQGQDDSGYFDTHDLPSASALVAIPIRVDEAMLCPGTPPGPCPMRAPLPAPPSPVLTFSASELVFEDVEDLHSHPLSSAEKPFRSDALSFRPRARPKSHQALVHNRKRPSETLLVATASALVDKMPKAQPRDDSPKVDMLWQRNAVKQLSGMLFRGGEKPIDSLYSTHDIESSVSYLRAHGRSFTINTAFHSLLQKKPTATFLPQPFLHVRQMSTFSLIPYDRPISAAAEYVFGRRLGPAELQYLEKSHVGLWSYLREMAVVGKINKAMGELAEKGTGKEGKVWRGRQLE